MRTVSTLLVAVMAISLAVPAAAGPKPKPGEVKLECKIVFGPGAEGKVRYEVKSGKTSFLASVEAAIEEDDPTDPDDVPLISETDTFPVVIGGSYLAGTIALHDEGDELEGALKLEKKAKGRNVKPFPADFPFGAMVAGTSVSLGAESCLLQDRSRPKPRGS